MSPIPSSEVRRAFLEFFAARGHEVVPSAPLLPQNDPTLMFVNAGMVPFKDVFTAKDTRPYTRATSSQKCIRISGKHNDLENVGVTARHQTFFEMLGSFSFGDYFKEDAVSYAWELLTKVFHIPEERLVITVFGGDDAAGFAADDEARAIRKRTTGFGDDRIIGLGLKDNFWQMGETGPCGPCTEIHFWNGAGEPDLAKFLEEPPPDGKGWTEIRNLVFMQYERFQDGGEIRQRPLPRPCVDTGMGLERISCVLQGVTSNYDTDLLRPLVDKASAVSGKPYRGGMADDDVSMRVIADHARTTAFLIAEGVTPEKQRREYVLRRVMRRAIRHGHRLGIERPFLHEIALEVVDRMGDAYPELKDRREMIARVTEDEEIRFRATLKRGMKILDERFAELRAANQRTLAAAAAADLYTTYGFPLDLTEVIAAESNFDVDVEGAEKVIHSAADADGPIDPNAAVDSAHRDARALLAEPVRFTGYEREEGAAPIVAIILVEDGEGLRRRLVDRAEVGARVEIVVAETPFYAESGGQVGDVGAISGSGFRVDVTDTVKPIAGLFAHVGVVREGVVSVGDAATLEVDHAARAATRRNHSATHLLHWALRKVVGEHAQQKGSRVGPDVLRFDFSSGKPLGPAEIARVEDLVNEKILTNAKVLTEIMPMDEAKKRGAMAIFEEKYGDTVRMLTMTPEVIELCGGTHARALGDIGLFKITGEAGVAAGVRRLSGVTGTNALLYVREAEAELTRARQAVKAQGGDLVDKITKLVQHERELEKKVAKLERELISGASGAQAQPGASAGPGGAAGPAARARGIGGIKVLAERVTDGTNAGVLRDTAEQWRDQIGERAVVVLAAATGGKAQLCVMVSKAATDKVKAGDLVKAIAKVVGGAGGGRPDMAQAGGPDVAKIDDAIAATYAEVERMVGAG